MDDNWLLDNCHIIAHCVAAVRHVILLVSAVRFAFAASVLTPQLMNQPRRSGPTQGLKIFDIDGLHKSLVVHVHDNMLTQLSSLVSLQKLVVRESFNVTASLRDS